MMTDRREVHGSVIPTAVPGNMQPGHLLSFIYSPFPPQCEVPCKDPGRHLPQPGHVGLLKNLAEERAGRLEKFYPHIIGCRVVIEAPHRSAEGHHPPWASRSRSTSRAVRASSPRMWKPQRELKGDHLSVVNRAFEAIERQLEELEREAARRGQAPRERAANRQRRAHVSGAGLWLHRDRQRTRALFHAQRRDRRRFRRSVGRSDGAGDQATSEGPMGPQASSVETLGVERRG